MRISILLHLLLFVTATASASDLRDSVRAWRSRSEAKILAEFRELLSIPNVVSDTPNIERNAVFISEMLRRRGIEPRLLRVEGAPPAVFGEIRTPGAKETLLLYAHYDGQPVDRSQWSSDPWVPVTRDDRIYARSASDDKAPIVEMLSAIDALRASGTPLRVNVKLFFEGEEEAGSVHLGAILEKYRDILGADIWLIGDGPVHQSRRQQLYYGVRGVMGLELTAYGPARPLHSGHYGNWAPNPIVTMTHLLASMRDEEGRILIADFYDDVRPLTAADRAALAEVPPVDEQLRGELALGRSEGSGTVGERTANPALNIRGIRGGNVGETAANVISTEAAASIDFRLVADQTPARVREKVEAHLRSRGFHIVHETPDLATRAKYPKVVKVEWEGGYPASRVALDHPLAVAIERRIEAFTGQQIIKLPTLGGSVPLYVITEKLGVPTLGVPTVNHDNNQHGANENVRVQNLWDGIEVFAAILAGE
jgi:acetylornithine deacetylase/succinyl-diaminopimelate desuccinylase-like protein